MTESNEDHIIVTIPALVTVLLRLEEEKGSALTKAEVIAARDNAVCVAMPRHAYQAVADARGYVDIDPERSWEGWLEFKASQNGGKV